MRGLHIAHVEVVVREHRAAYRGDKNRPVLNAQLIDSPGQHLVRLAVPAPWAKVRLMLKFFLALIAPVERLRLAVRHRVFWNRFARHLPSAPLPAAWPAGNAAPRSEEQTSGLQSCQ